MTNQHDVLNQEESKIAQELAQEKKDIKKYWFHHSVFATSFFDAQSIIIPDGERFIISSVQKLIPKIQDEEFKIKVSNLIHEESAHSRVHEAYNQMLSREGYRLDFSARLGKHMFSFFRKYFSDMTNLAISMSLEYFTFIFSKNGIENNLFDGDGVDKKLKRL